MPSWFCDKHIHGISPWAYLLIQPMSTPTYCMFGVDILPLPINTIRDRNYAVWFHNCANWVTGTPTNLHPNILGNHFEIHFQWHIDSSLLNNPWNKIFTTELLDLDYIMFTRNCFMSILRAFWLPNWHVYNWSDCSIIYTVMDKIVIQKADLFSV